MGVAGAGTDWGLKQQKDTRDNSMRLFGVSKPLTASSSVDLDAATATAHPDQLFQLANGLQARVLTSMTEAGQIAAPNVDMIALWPSDTNPTDLVYCNEQETDDPGVQRFNLATGEVTTIVTGTVDCDGVRRTAWGTVLFSEEAGSGPSGGRVYELFDPLHTAGVTLDRTTGTTSGGTGAANIVPRPALGRNSFEGFALYSTGLVYYGDENRPFNGAPGGAMYKYVPTNPYLGGPTPAPDQSPFAAGTIYGLRLGKRSGNTDYGQGTETGAGTWLLVGSGNDLDLRTFAPPPAYTPPGIGLTGFYRPEDIDIDRVAEAAGSVRFCGPMTGNETDDQTWGKVVCFTDGTLDAATAGTAVPAAQNLVLGNPQFAMPDNIAFQPGRHNWVIHEDADTTFQGSGLGNHNDDLWSCLGDGGDDDQLSDGCVRIATLRDIDAEWTGGIFDATGTHFYVSIQHNSSGKGVILDITGWQ
jgi:secreted PhoX family phosphatase